MELELYQAMGRRIKEPLTQGLFLMHLFVFFSFRPWQHVLTLEDVTLSNFRHGRVQQGSRKQAKLTTAENSVAQSWSTGERSTETSRYHWSRLRDAATDADANDHLGLTPRG